MRLPTALPILAKAALVGAKIVTSVRESTVLTRLACVRAPAREVRPVSRAVVESFGGMGRTVSISWIMPPLNCVS